MDHQVHHRVHKSQTSSLSMNQLNSAELHVIFLQLNGTLPLAQNADDSLCKCISQFPHYDLLQLHRTVFHSASAGRKQRHRIGLVTLPRPKIFQKSTSHFKILGAIALRKNKFNAKTHKYEAPP